jgi:energy-coupling factor transporter ATP-binding protein EcfA2
MRLTKLRIKTRLCSEIGNAPVELKLNPFYNAVIGSRGSGKSTLVESIRIAMRKDKGLPADTLDQISSFKTIGQGMDSDSMLECFYRKNGTDFKFSWLPGEITSLQVYNEGSWIDDTNWSDDRFNISIFSQKMLYQLASDQGAFLKICDDSTLVDKRTWNETKTRLEHEYKNERIKLRSLISQKESESALQGELTDAVNAIGLLNDSPYYDVRTKLNELESKLTLIEQQFVDENTILDNVLNFFPEPQNVAESTIVNPDSQADNQASDIEQEPSEYSILLGQIDSIKEIAKTGIVTVIQTAKSNLELLSTGQYLTELKSSIDTSKQEVETEAEKLREQGLNPDELDGLVELKTKIVADLLAYQDLDTKITTSNAEINRIYNEMLEHRKELSIQRKSFIDSLDLEDLEIKILPLNSTFKQVISSYQSATGISSFNDRIYDTEARTGILKAFIEHPTFAPQQTVIDRKYQYLHELKNLHIEVFNNDLTNASDIHGALKTKIGSLSEESMDNLLCWFPDDGIQIRYKTLSGSMENIETASPGQKAANMLQFLLSYGLDPLILDQPEDDLDCLMLSNSVIPAIVRNKQKRQLIIVSHSAPIVVNGDAEYVISMKHDSQGLRSHIQGALQEQAVKDNICNQMEGGEKAFRSRFNRILN